MKHLGDITRIKGAEVPPVNVIIGGSPCQDLSVAGKRAGLAGERSGLFMEQLRVIKEMRKADAERGRTGKEIRPRFMVWENVPGAFSSNHGKDFAAVLNEVVRVIVQKAPPVPMPEKGWPTSGCLVGDGWSVAWRILDAQFWGTPQRRRRIALVADFGGITAPEILFVRKGMSRDSEPGGTAREGLAGSTKESPGSPVWCLQGNGIDRADTAGCNGKGWTQEHGHQPSVLAYSFDSISSNSMKSGNPNSGCRVVDIAKTLDTFVPDPSKNQGGICILDITHACDVVRDCGSTTPSLQARMGTGGNQVPLVAYGIGNGQVNEAMSMAYEKVQTLNTMHDAQAIFCQDTSHALKAKASCDFREDSETYPVQNHKVRRLTPLECERLQGFPDGWTDIGDWVDSKGKKRQTTDSARYKALGNSIALPPWFYVLQKLSLCCGADWTMASLFDGIGGFPLIWETLNGNDTCLWASEIEEFPIAVTKIHFPEGGNTNG